MFCRFCGANLPDGSAFCTSCGNALEGGAQGTPAQPQTPPPQAPAQPVYVRAVYTQPVYTQPVYTQPAYAAPRPVGDPRRVGSALLLIAAIMYCLNSLASLLWYVFGSIFGYFFPFYLIFLIETIVSFLVSITLSVALFITFGKTRSNAQPLPVGGALSFARIMIIVLLAERIVEVISRIIINGGFYFAYRYLIDLFLFVSILVFAIIAVGAIKKAKPDWSVIVTAVMCFVCAAWEMIDGIVDFSGFRSFMGLVDFLGDLAYVTALTLFGVLLLKYNGAAKNAAR